RTRADYAMIAYRDAVNDRRADGDRRIVANGYVPASGGLRREADKGADARIVFDAAAGVQDGMLADLGIAADDGSGHHDGARSDTRSSCDGGCGVDGRHEGQVWP